MGPGGPAPAWDAGAQVSRAPGCMKVGLGLLIGLFVLFVVFVAVVIIVASSIIGHFGGNAGTTGGGGLDAPCPYLSNADAQQVLGGDASANQLNGLTQATIGLVLDTRVLPSDPSCWVSGGQKAFVARIAVHQGSDAATVFATERQKAAPTSQDQGGGLSLENAGYFAGDVGGLGDQAFCTGISPAIMAGVLVRKGDEDVYVSVGSADGTSAPPDLGTTDSGVVTAPDMCSLAQDLARKIIH